MLHKSLCNNAGDSPRCSLAAVSPRRAAGSPTVKVTSLRNRDRAGNRRPRSTIDWSAAARRPCRPTTGTSRSIGHGPRADSRPRRTPCPRPAAADSTLTRRGRADPGSGSAAGRAAAGRPGTRLGHGTGRRRGCRELAEARFEPSFRRARRLRAGSQDLMTPSARIAPAPLCLCARSRARA